MDVFPDLRRLRFVIDQWSDRYRVLRHAEISDGREYIEDRLGKFMAWDEDEEKIKVCVRRWERNAGVS